MEQSNHKFPGPVLPPGDVAWIREKRKQDLIRSTGRGIIIRLLIVLAELVGVLFFESSALFADALATLFDISSSIVLLYFIRYAAKPPDKNHPFGHGRLEPIVGLQLGLLLVVAGGGIAVQQLSLTYNIQPNPHLSPWAALIPLVATLLLEAGYRYLYRVAKRNDSQALLAEARHFRLDAVTSLIATISLSFALFAPTISHHADHIGAFGIALFMIFLGYRSVKDNIAELMDKTPDPEYFGKVKRASLKVDGVKGVEKIRIQHYGPDSHVDIDVEVDPEMSVYDAHEISQKVRAEIQKEWPKVRDVTVHIEPYFPEDHP
ncbi:MAG: cation diffusion facilitator family transporter [Parachlamydiaceae bacterium]